MEPEIQQSVEYRGPTLPLKVGTKRYPRGKTSTRNSISGFCESAATPCSMPLRGARCFADLYENIFQIETTPISATKRTEFFRKGSGSPGYRSTIPCCWIGAALPCQSQQQGQVTGDVAKQSHTISYDRVSLIDTLSAAASKFISGPVTELTAPHTPRLLPGARPCFCIVSGELCTAPLLSAGGLPRVELTD